MSRTAPRSRGPQALGACGAFATLAGRAAALDALDRALRQTLAPPLRDEVRFANLRGGRLLFLASTPAWATRLRLLQTQILATARSLDIRAESLAVKVSPLPRIELEPERTRTLSPAAASHLRAAAAAAGDPEWQELFGKLAALAKPITPAR
ncbi:DciA family protein [Rhodanobacter aciditrophus]|uniref:DciA family protein n=1 Tax=Rhodanobacter aciditrophus TaxID=1623218 RepID=UPI003CEFBD19